MVMPRNINPLTRVALTVAETIKSARRRAAQTNPIPVGQQRLRAREARRRLPDMSVEEKRELLQQVGRRRFLNLLQGIEGGPNGQRIQT